MIVKAAQYLQVPPWDLLNRPTPWIDMAVAAMNAEAHAREMHEKRSKIQIK